MKKKKKGQRRSTRRDEREENAELYEPGMWIEALTKNRKPYLIAQIVRVLNGGRSFDLKYEDGYKERNV